MHTTLTATDRAPLVAIRTPTSLPWAHRDQAHVALAISVTTTITRSPHLVGWATVQCLGRLTLTILRTMETMAFTTIGLASATPC